MDIQGIRDVVAKIEAGLRVRSENGKGFYPEYPRDRKELLSHTEVKQYVPSFILNSPDAEVAFGYMRNHSSGTGSWAARRQFVNQEFSVLRQFLDKSDGSAVLIDEDDLISMSLPAVSYQLRRAKLLVSTDPASALTKAETVIASVCKHILVSEGEIIGKTESVTSLVSKTARSVLKLDKELSVSSFSGISNQAQLVAEIRNRYGDAHPAPDPDDDLAEFAVTQAGALAIFLLKRYERRSSGGSS